MGLKMELGLRGPKTRTQSEASNGGKKKER